MNHVDVPVTDLDDLDDDIIISAGDDESTLFGPAEFDIDNISLKQEQLQNRNMAQRVMDSARGIFGKPRLNYYDNIELSDDPFSTIYGTRRNHRLHYVVLIAVVVVVAIALAVIVHHSHSSHPSNKVSLSNGTHAFYTTTLLISLDGFHPHYLSDALTPYMSFIFENGYGTPYMVPSFPSSTFPNHWTMITGLYPADHGIVGNSFYDPVSGKQFVNTHPEQSLDLSFWGGEPIWKSVAKSGIKSAVHMWPGSEVPGIAGKFPLEVDRFNGSEILSAKRDRILQWLDRDIQARPELILTYVPTIDTLGHRYGISGAELEKGLSEVDGFIESVFAGLSQRNLTDIVNVVVVSDHGMAPTSNERIVFLDNLVSLEKIEHIDGWPLFGLRPFAEVNVSQVYHEMVKDTPEGCDIYLKEDLPSEWNFGGHHMNSFYDRIAPLWVVPKVGYSITTKEEFKRNNYDYHPKGVHGYNNTEVLMRALFMGSGPYFQDKLHGKSSLDKIKVRPFENTELYGILCDIFKVKPAPNNGTCMVLGEDNLLDREWSDPFGYPGVPHDDIRLPHQNATYDVMYRKGKSDEKGSPPTSTSAALHSSTIQQSTSSTDLEPTSSRNSISSSAVFPSSSSASSSSASSKGFWDSVSDVIEDVEDELEHAGDAIGDMASDIGEKVGEAGDKLGDAMENIGDRIEDVFDV